MLQASLGLFVIPNFVQKTDACYNLIKFDDDKNLHGLAFLKDAHSKYLKVFIKNVL